MKKNLKKNCSQSLLRLILDTYKREHMTTLYEAVKHLPDLEESLLQLIELERNAS